METPYARITEIREVGTSNEANECLGSGFVLIKAVEKRSVDALGRQDSTVLYVLDKLKGRGAPQPQPDQPNGHSTEPQTDTVMVDPTILEGRPWRQYENGNGEWTFITSQDGNLLPELEPARDFIEKLRSGEDLIIGNYKYRARDKFLKRYPANNGQHE
jgi:hypothetical protein